VLADVTWARRSLASANGAAAKDIVASLYRKSVAATICTIAVQVIALSLMFFGSDKPTFLDALQAPLLRIRYVLSGVPALLLLASLPFMSVHNRKGS